MSRHVVILGAGISGLATAWYLKKKLGSTIRVTILEKELRAGGWIQTISSNGFLFEQGPRSLRSSGKGQTTLELIEELGLQDQILLPSSDATMRYIYTGGSLQALPKQLWEVPFRSLTRDWLKVLWSDLRASKRTESDESIASFFSRRLGKKWTENMIDPFVSGIYGGDISLLSLKSCFPMFDNWEKQRGSLFLGALTQRSLQKEKGAFVRYMSRFPLYSFREGMETLPRALVKELQESLVLGKGASRVVFHPENVAITLETGECIFADHLISTLSAPRLSALLQDQKSLATTLKELSYASMAVVNAGFNAALPCKGFGYLIPSQLGLKVLGVVWDSSVFPQHNRVNQSRITCMIGGRHHPEVEAMSDNDLIAYTLEVLVRHMNITMKPDCMQIKRAWQAIPQYEVGYSEWRKKIEKESKPLQDRLTLSGTAFGGISIHDCIAEAQSLVSNYGNS